MSEIITPANVERRLVELSSELDTATEELNASEHLYYQSKTTYEITLASKRLEIAGELKGTKSTVSEREDMALVQCEDYAYELATAEATVKAARANVSRIRTQIDIARSLGTSVRSAYEMA